MRDISQSIRIELIPDLSGKITLSNENFNLTWTRLERDDRSIGAREREREKGTRHPGHCGTLSSIVWCLFIFFAYCRICRWCFLERAQYAQKSESKPSHHTFYPSGHKYKALFSLPLLLLLLCVVLSHYRCRFSAKRMHFFSSSMPPHIRPYIRCVQA